MHYMEPSSQPLHIVNFKCSRSDVYYVQQGSGLNIRVGDLVIVDADRGIDLGTVQHTNITWEEARRYKEHYAEEHYKWLMMFSKQSRNGGPNVINPNGLPTKAGSAVGGMGPSNQHAPHENSHDLKPRMIKRLAAPHEVVTLKEKEGNEAKAKRTCQNKVAEHRLNMEILDAEFQL
jgi:cell fate regulator YaaT (PSP1 superfamily)